LLKEMALRLHSVRQELGAGGGWLDDLVEVSLREILP